MYLRILILAFGVLSALVVSQSRAEGQRPNVILFLADDLGWGDLGCYGAKDIRTPHIDQLARDGVRFTQFYANGPECTPTRTALLTGRYQQRVGGMECAIGIGSVGRYDDAIRLAAQQELGLPTSQSTISRLLRDAGYATALTGKWHLGYQDKFAPRGHGFDYAFYCLGGGMDYFHHVEDPPNYLPVLRVNGQPIERVGYFTEQIADEATNWLRRAASATSTPFFLYVAFTAPHAPYQGPDDRLETPLPANSDRWQQGKASPQVYAAMVESMDKAVGRILAELDSSHAAGNTLVVFTSDNGGTASARPTKLRGSKGTTFEGGIRVPCIARWPKVLAAGVEYSHAAMTFDLTASISRLASVQPPHPYDGVDILNSVSKSESPPARTLYWRQRRGDRTWRGVREGQVKYVSDTRGDTVSEFLFDLSSDESESKNLIAIRRDDAQRIKDKLANWEREVKPIR